MGEPRGQRRRGVTRDWGWQGVCLATMLLLVGVYSGSGQVSRPPGKQIGAPGGRSAVSGLEELDPVSRLQSLIMSGDLHLAFDSARGYLPALLEALEIPVSSQGLVFSRTSLQTDLISPWTPRALYFNDDVYVGWVQESSIIEIAAIDPDEGAVFYTLGQDGTQPPVFQRETTTCLMCHEGRALTGGVPGIVVRSVLADRYGYPISPIHEGVTSDRTPLAKRWGGWYVTGTHGDQPHAGNKLAPLLSHEVTNGRRYVADFDFRSDGNNLQSLDGLFDVDPYLTPHSDVVALLVLAHQARVHNLITLAHRTYREAMRDQASALRISGDALPDSVDLLPSTRVRIEGVVGRLVKAMVFTEEASLGEVEGTSSFVEDFQRRGPRDSAGRSLRDLHLNGRLFEHPVSFLVYSDAFQALPGLIRRAVYRELAAALNGQESVASFTNLADEERTALGVLLDETVPGFRDPSSLSVSR